MNWNGIKDYIRTIDSGCRRFRIDDSDTLIMMYNESGTILFSKDNSVHFTDEKGNYCKIINYCPFDIMKTLVDIFYACEKEG